MLPAKEDLQERRDRKGGASLHESNSPVFHRLFVYDRKIILLYSFGDCLSSIHLDLPQITRGNVIPHEKIATWFRIDQKQARHRSLEPPCLLLIGAALSEWELRTRGAGRC